MIRKTTFRKQITRMLFLIAFIGFIISIIIYGSDRKKTKENMISNMITENTRVSLVLDISLNNLNELYNFQNMDYKARNILLKSNEELSSRDRFDNTQYMENMLTHVLFMNKILTRATIISKYGDIYNYGYYLSKDYLDYVTEESKKLGNETKILYTKPRYYYFNNIKYQLVTIMRNISIYDKNRLAVLYIDVDYDMLKKIIMSTLQHDKSSNILILNKDEVIYSISENNKDPEEDKLKAIADCSKTISKSEYGKCTIDKEKYIVTAQKNDSTGWTIIQYKNEKDLFKQINQEMIIRLFVIACVFAISAFISYIYARKISRPLELFDQQIRAQNNSELKMVELATSHTSEEIKNVIDSYNDLIIRINEYIRKTIIYETNQKIAQMTMLRYQINPHFMFNTLNTISSLAIISEDENIAMMIDNLSKIMQYNVHGSRFVLLEDEMKMIHSYMEIQNFRFPDRFEVEYNIDKSLNKVMIIKFIIQPIVENIFEHGFKNSMKYKGKIKISAFTQKDDLIIEIQDNGTGMTQDQLQMLENMLQNTQLEDIDAENTKWNSNIGMRNVNARLRNYYGDDYGINLTSAADSGTTVRLRMKISYFS
mgnify:CR=1 FL=1